MKVIKIEPQGFCNGVKFALNKLYDALNDQNTPRPIYLLGPIIHNSYVNDKLKDLGVIILDNQTRFDMLNQIDSGSVVFSAHGVSDRVYQKALDKKLNIIDTTCPNVKTIQNNIKEKLNTHTVLYIGKPNHPECEAILELSEKITLIIDKTDLDNLILETENIYITNQTTLSKYDLIKLYDYAKDKYPSIVIDDKICNATTLRQDAILNQEDVDLCLIVGDPKSSNSNRLKELSLNVRKIKTYLISDYKMIEDEWLQNVNTISVSAGASTPDYLINAVIEYLKNK